MVIKFGHSMNITQDTEWGGGGLAGGTLRNVALRAADVVPDIPLAGGGASGWWWR